MVDVRNCWIWGLMLALALGAAGGVQGQEPKANKLRSGRAEKSAKVDVGTESILGLPWHKSLDGAIAANLAGRTERDQRPILFMRLLGDLKGKT